jgi:hypothetical protein
MSANFRNPNFLLPNELNRKLPASGAETGSGLTEDRHSLYSMEFDGASYIDASAATGLTQTSQLSISMWISQNNITAFDYYLSIGDNLGSPTEFLELYSHPTASRSFNVEGSIATSGFQSFDFTSYVSNDIWFHLALVWDSTESVATDRIKVYINGTLRGNLSGVTSSFNTNGEIKIGRTWRHTSNTIDGQLDEVAIFNSALTLSEVQALSTASAPANIMALNKKPIAYYPLGEQARDNTEWQFPNEVLQSQVFDFDATDYINVSPVLPLQGLSSFSISSWVYWDGHGGGSDQWIFMHANAGNTKRIQVEIYGSDLYFQILGTGGGYVRVDMPQGRWVNLLCVFNSSEAAADRMIVYIDGDRAPDVVYVAPTMTTTDTDYTYSMIGARNDGYYFDGKMSNVAVWNSDQSSEKDNIYNNGSPASSYTTYSYSLVQTKRYKYLRWFKS